MFSDTTTLFNTNLHGRASLHLPKQQIPVHSSKFNSRVLLVKPFLTPPVDLSALSPMLPLHLLQPPLNPYCTAVSLLRGGIQYVIFLCALSTQVRS